MKLKKIFAFVLAILISFITTTVNADTTAPSSYNVNSNDLYLLDGSKYLPGGAIHFYYKVNTDGKVIYCIDRTMNAPWGNVKYTLSKELSASYAYIMENGYPNKSMTGDNNKDYFITAFAVWYLVNPNDTIFTYFDLPNGLYRGKTNDVSIWVNKLVTGAKNYSYTTPTISINNSNTEMTLSGDYYVSSLISVSTTGTVGNYKVALNNAPSGTIITDSNGNSKDTFGTSESFMVKVPTSSINELSSSFKVSVTATGSVTKAYLYSPSNSSYQNTGTIYPVTTSLKADTTLNITKVTKVSISKQDATTGEELPGAKLVLKDESGNVVDEWTSTDTPHVVEGLSAGKYYLTEEIAPEGYSLSKETVTFTVKKDGTVDGKVVMLNAPIKSVVISKQDATTGEELPGAHLELRNEKGELVEAWVSGDEPHTIEGLEPGKYTLTETLAPEGYELSTETVEFTVNEDGSVDGVVVMYNKPETIVEVPSTGTFKTITTSLIGLIVIGLGSVVIYRNYKKNEEV